MALLVPIGLLLKGFIIFDTPYSLFIYSTGTYVLAIGYIALFAWLFSRYQKTMNYYFAPIGKLSLTNYLMQSIICTIIFLWVWFWVVWEIGYICWNPFIGHYLWHSAQGKSTLFKALFTRTSRNNFKVVHLFKKILGNWISIVHRMEL